MTPAEIVSRCIDDDILIFIGPEGDLFLEGLTDRLEYWQDYVNLLQSGIYNSLVNRHWIN